MIALSCPAFVLGSFLSADRRLYVEIENRDRMVHVVDRVRLRTVRSLVGRVLVLRRVVELEHQLPPMATVILPVDLPPGERAIVDAVRIQCHAL